MKNDRKEWNGAREHGVAPQREAQLAMTYGPGLRTRVWGHITSRAETAE